jgi:hypothetical protein
MRRALSTAAGAALLAFAGAGSLGAASDSVTRSIQVNAQVASRTSLSVSSHVLRFTVPSPNEPAVASVDFVAGVRTPAGAEVVLTVEALRELDDAGPDAVVVTFAGDGEGAVRGALGSAGPAVAGRWVGSGRRTGRITFALETGTAGTYTLPVRFVLSAP